MTKPSLDEPLGFEPLGGGPLTDGDYSLAEDGVWIESHPFAVRLLRTTGGLDVKIYRNGQEDQTAVASTYAALSSHQD